MHFICEKRNGLYKWYYPGVSQQKNVLGAKKLAEHWICQGSDICCKGIASCCKMVYNTSQIHLSAVREYSRSGYHPQGSGRNPDRKSRTRRYWHVRSEVSAKRITSFGSQMVPPLGVLTDKRSDFSFN